MYPYLLLSDTCQSSYLASSAMETLNEISKICVSAVNWTDDREAHEKFWVAAYTRPRCEKKAVAEIKKLGIETYLPTQVQIRQWSDRKKKIETAIIPMVAFFYVDKTEISFIRNHALIIRIISQPGETAYARIPDIQIEKLKFVLGQSDVPVSFVPDLKVEDNVRIVRGNLIGLTGKVIQSEYGETDIIVGIDFLGGCKLRINRLNIELL